MIKNMTHMFLAARRCLDERQIMPCLTLLYAGIDVMSSLEAARKEQNSVSFKRWVENYLLPLTSWKCTAVDLYNARCAIVHTFTPHSGFPDRGQAKLIYYAHPGADPSKLEQVNSHLNQNANASK